MMRLSHSGAELLDRWLAGRYSSDTEAAVQLRQRMLDAGLLHPVWAPADLAHHRIGVVVPVLDDLVGLAALLAAVRIDLPTAPIVVVDDGSTDPSQVFAIAVEAEATVVRHEVNQGPSAARNDGVRALADVDIVLFVDADVIPERHSIGTLIGHFNDEAVVAVAPRVRAAVGSSALARYEAEHSPLDMGDTSARVQRGSETPYVPTTMLAVRLSAFDHVGGFDTRLRIGEDVDLIWRLLDNSGVVRFEPRAVARHRNRGDWKKLAQQRHDYGRAAADLDKRFPGHVAPVDLPGATLAAWLMFWLGGIPGAVAGLGVAAVDAVRLERRLASADDDREVRQLVFRSHGRTGHWLGRAVTRTWLPAFAAASLFSTRARVALGAAALVPPAVDWILRLPPLDPARYIGARLLDDAAYCSGVWRGVITGANPRPLWPRVRRPQK